MKNVIYQKMIVILGLIAILIYKHKMILLENYFAGGFEFYGKYNMVAFGDIMYNETSVWREGVGFN